MLPIEKLQQKIQGKKVAFIGAGVSHKRCLEQFVEMGAQVTLCDQKKSIEDFGEYAETLHRLNVRLSLGEHYTDGFAGQDIIMRTPGYEYYKPELQAALRAGATVTSEVELFFELCPCEIVAVTGSDGKTTTTTLISKMFEAAGRKVFLGGNIGAALLPQLADVTPDAVAVVELSSFQLISMRTSPKVAVVTNVTPNHLDHHKDMQEYVDAKRNILLWQVPPCRAVLGFENDITRAMQSDCKGEQVWFTRLHETDNGAFLRAEDDTLCYAENGVVTPIMPRADIKLRGLHNVENLHCGGIDNAFPHHTNEIAQSESYLGHPWCPQWCHVAHLNTSSGKMSKSKGEFLTVSLLEEKGYDPLAYRFFCLQSHYRKGLVFTWENLDNAAGTFKKLIAKIAALDPAEAPIDEDAVAALREKFHKALGNDLNTSLAITALYDVLKYQTNDATKRYLLNDFDQVLSLDLLKKADEERKKQASAKATGGDYSIIAEDGTPDAEIEAQIRARYEAKKAKNFAEADRIREALKAAGVEVTDVPGGAKWKRI